MEFIAHRINTVEELREVPSDCGVEIDLRDHGNQLIMQHDPFTPGENFEEYIEHYHHGTLILNVKSERIEYRILDLLSKNNIKNYFFLDCSFPMIYALSEAGEKNLALRYSEYEGMDVLKKMAGKAAWVWVDCFKSYFLNNDIARRICDLGYKICIVSPELQKRPEEVIRAIEVIKKENWIPDAVCCKLKNKSEWYNIINTKS
jgi:hypothetical protein